MKDLTIRVNEVTPGRWVVEADNADDSILLTLTARSVGEAVNTAYSLLWYYLKKKGTQDETGSVEHHEEAGSLGESPEGKRSP